MRVNERLSRWKDLRHEISELPLKDAMTEVCLFWSSTPFVTFYLHADQPDTFPDPWTLLSENYYCDVAKALGIMYTIYFSSHKTVDLQLEIYYDHKTKSRSNVVSVNNGQYIINYWPFEIVNTTQLEKEQLDLLYRYSPNDLQLEKY